MCCESEEGKSVSRSKNAASWYSAGLCLAQGERRAVKRGKMMTARCHQSRVEDLLWGDTE
jgi:hypothetical protein